jgi:hypothetical protein
VPMSWIRIGSVVLAILLTHKDRLLRFGAELIFALCEIQAAPATGKVQGLQATVRSLAPRSLGL